MPFVLPLMWALVGPQLPDPPVLPLPDMVQEASALDGWHAVAGGCVGLAIGTGTPSAVVGGGAGLLAWLYPQAFSGALTGIGPALLALGTVEAMIFSAACFPMCGSLFAAAGAAWGAQREGREPWIALAGATPGLALAAISSALTIAAMGVALTGFTAVVPALVLTGLAVATGLPAPFIAFAGATFSDAAWPGFKHGVARAQRRVGVVPDDAAMAY